MLTPENILAFAGLVLGFSFLIFVHELGHFVVAKLVGIKCTQFAIGFGQALVSYRKGIGFRIGSTEPEYEKLIEQKLGQHKDVLSDDREMTSDIPMSKRHAEDYPDERVDTAAAELGLGETEYRLNWMPLGGYVKMLGQEDMDPGARSSHPRSFNSKSIMARFWVLSAGVIMNMIFGAILLAIAFSPQQGVQFPAPVVGGVGPGSPAETTYPVGHEDPAFRGMQVGDRIVAINGRPADDFMDVRLATALGKAGEAVEFEIEREIDGTATRLVYPIVPAVSPGDGLLSAGVAPSPSLKVGAVRRDGKRQAGVSVYGPNLDAGITPGMVVVEADGQAITEYAQLHRRMIAAQGRDVAITLLDEETGQRADGVARATPRLTTRAGEPHNLLGFRPATMIAPASNSKLKDKAEPRDIVARLGSAVYPDVEALSDAVKAADEQIEVVVYRDGQEIDLGKAPLVGGKLQVNLMPTEDAPIISDVMDDSPAAAMAKAYETIPAGSRIVSVNGQQVEDWSAVQRELMASASAWLAEADSDGAEDSPKREPLAVLMEIEIAVAGRPVEAMTLSLDTEAAELAAKAGWYDAPRLGLEVLNVLVVGDNLAQATTIGVEKTHEFMLQTYVTLARLFQGSVKISHLRGPVGIVDEGTKIATRGFPYLLFFLGLISVNLAVINFLPIPIVDGGHVVFLIIEKIKGSPVGPKVQTYASLAGLAVIGFVFLTTLYYDVGRLGVLDWFTGLFS